MSPGKSTQVSLHFWQAWRGERIMLDNDIDSWILQAWTSTCSLVFSYFESLKNMKKTPGGCFFLQFSLISTDKDESRIKSTTMKKHKQKIQSLISEKIDFLLFYFCLQKGGGGKVEFLTLKRLEIRFPISSFRKCALE